MSTQLTSLSLADLADVSGGAFHGAYDPVALKYDQGVCTYMHQRAYEQTDPNEEKYFRDFAKPYCDRADKQRALGPQVGVPGRRPAGH